MKSAKTLSVVCVALFFFTYPASKADDFYVWAEETGGEVVFYYEGSIDLTGFPTVSSTVPGAGITPEFGALISGDSNFDVYTSTIPTGTSRSFGSGDTTTGGIVVGDDFALGAGLDLGLPMGYVSGSPISGSLAFTSTDFETLGVETTPFTFDTTVGDNTIHMFTMPPVLPPANENAFANASEKSALFRGIKGLQKKIRKLKKKGKKAKAKKLLKKVKKLKKRLAALG